MIVVCRWNGQRGESLPSPADGGELIGRDLRRSQLGLTAEDGPVVTWTDRDDAGRRQVFAARWDGIRWQRLGDRAGVVSDCDGSCWSPAIDGASPRCVVWEEMADRSRKISVRCQDEA